MKRILMLAMTIQLLTISPVWTEVPTVMNYQGRLVDRGNLVNQTWTPSCATTSSTPEQCASFKKPPLPLPPVSNELEQELPLLAQRNNLSTSFLEQTVHI